MSGDMRRRSSKFTKEVAAQLRKARGFNAPQKDNSVRSKKRAKLNDYTNQDHQRGTK